MANLNVTHIHLPTSPSTHQYLLDNVLKLTTHKRNYVLVTTHHQTAGYGTFETQHGGIQRRAWEGAPGNVAATLYLQAVSAKIWGSLQAISLLSSTMLLRVLSDAYPHTSEHLTCKLWNDLQIHGFKCAGILGQIPLNGRAPGSVKCYIGESERKVELTSTEFALHLHEVQQPHSDEQFKFPLLISFGINLLPVSANYGSLLLHEHPTKYFLGIDEERDLGDSIEYTQEIEASDLLLLSSSLLEKGAVPENQRIPRLFVRAVLELERSPEKKLQQYAAFLVSGDNSRLAYQVIAVCPLVSKEKPSSGMIERLPRVIDCVMNVSTQNIRKVNLTTGTFWVQLDGNDEVVACQMMSEADFVNKKDAENVPRSAQCRLAH